jgi:hypothetical protein
VSLVTRSGDGRAEVYRFPGLPVDGEVHTLELVATLVIDGVVDADRQITAGDWDLAGQRVALRTGGRVLHWATDPERPNLHWSEPPDELPIPGAPDGEGLAWAIDGALVATSEGQPMSVTVIPCTDSAPTDAEACVFPQSGGCGCGAAPAPAGLLPLWLATWLVGRRRRPTGGR